MPPSALPTFTNAAPLSASDLNTLSDWVEYLYARSGAINASIPATFIADAGTINYVIQHKHRYLHYRITADDAITIDYDTTEVFSDGSPTPPVVGYVDLNSFGLTIGQWYTLAVFVDSNSTPPGRYVHYLYESESTS